MTLIPPLHKPSPRTFTLRRIEKLTDDVSEFYLESETRMGFEAGQFVNINIPSTEKKIVRSYSIASAPDSSNTIVLCIKLVAGPGSQYFRSLNVGDTLTGSGPFGLFAMKDDYSAPLLFIGTGTGVAPLKAMIEYRQSKGQKDGMTLLFGVRHEEDIFYDQLFCSYTDVSPDFSYTLTLSQPKRDGNFENGRVTDTLKKLQAEGVFDSNARLDHSQVRVFICGNGSMITEVIGLLESYGVPPDRIYHEKFF